MALKGTGSDLDISLKAGSSLKTTTAQFKVCGMENSSTTDDFTAYMADAGAAVSNTNTARRAIGIVQTYPSSGSAEVSVRIHGLSKAVCAGSVSAGDFVAAYEGASTTTFPGHIVRANAAAETVLTTTVAKVILGRALETGQTNSVISVFVNPAPYPLNAAG